MPWFGNQHDLADAALQRNIGLSMRELVPACPPGAVLSMTSTPSPSDAP